MVCYGSSTFSIKYLCCPLASSSIHFRLVLPEQLLRWSLGCRVFIRDLWWMGVDTRGSWNIVQVWDNFDQPSGAWWNTCGPSEGSCAGLKGQGLPPSVGGCEPLQGCIPLDRELSSAEADPNGAGSCWLSPDSTPCHGSSAFFEQGLWVVHPCFQFDKLNFIINVSQWQMHSPNSAFCLLGFQINRHLQYCTSRDRFSTIWKPFTIALSIGRGVVSVVSLDHWIKNIPGIFRDAHTLRFFFILSFKWSQLTFFLAASLKSKATIQWWKSSITFFMPFIFREIFQWLRFQI